MEKITFLTRKVGDILYYVKVTNTSIKGGAEIKTARITNIDRPRLTAYNMVLTLDNGEIITVHCNSSLATIDNNSEKKLSEVLMDLVKPIDVTFYSTNPDEVKDSIKFVIGKNIAILDNHVKELQEEIVRLAGLRTLAEYLKVKKEEEITANVTIV